jgi:carbamate kinase 2
MADELIILTSVDMVYKNFGKEDQEGISSMTVAEAQKYIEEGQFGATDMLPKIEAAIAYLAKKPDGQVLITSLAQTNNALKGKTGTIITA